MNRDLIEKTYWASADLLSLATQIQRATDLPPPEELQQRIADMFDRMSRRCRELGVLEEDARDAKYAICALMDELVLQSNWPGRDYWLQRPLQLIHFNENTAGEGFFVRLDALRRNRQRVNVTAIYFICLQFGFQGRYAINRGAGLPELAEQLAREIGQDLPAPDVLAPHGEPKDAGRGTVRRDLPFVAVGLGILGFALVVVLILKGTLFASTSSLTSRLSTAAATGAPAKKP
jgi:type VI secretion system protein ImpK